MNALMRQLIVSGVVVMALAASAPFASGKDKDVSGRWTFTAEGYVLEMVLVQTGTKLSGTLHGPHGPMPLKGEFAKGRITFSGGGPDGVGGNEELSATGVLKSDGTLAGELTSTTSGKLIWKAVRVGQANSSWTGSKPTNVVADAGWVEGHSSDVVRRS